MTAAHFAAICVFTTFAVAVLIIGIAAIVIVKDELHKICDEIQAESDRAVAAIDNAADNWTKANAELESEPPYDELLRCLENDWNITVSWDGLRRFWHIGLTEEGVRLRDAELRGDA